MDSIYSQSFKIYRKLAKELILDNIEIINRNKKDKRPIKIFKFTRDKIIIPKVVPSPKSNFFTITPFNIFTKDDPILRYLPSIKHATSSSIIWFEGALFGTKPLNINNMVDLIFLRYCEIHNKEQEGVDYIKKTYGRDPIIEIGAKSMKKCSMNDLFCSLCYVFSCGIHNGPFPQVLNMKEDKSRCICLKNNATQINKESKLYNNSTISLSTYKFRTFVLSFLKNLFSNSQMTCRSLKSELKHKKVTLTKKIIDPKQFYQPCIEEKRCSKNQCKCYQNGTYCESFCECLDCSNVFFCSCI